MNFISGLAGLGIGTVFGITLEKAEVTKKKIIQDQMLFKDQRMLKVFLTASGTSAVVLSLLQYTNSPFFHPRLSPTRVLSNSLGGIILGIGMQMGGGCPGTFLSALGSGSKAAPYGLLGGFLGATFYSLLFPLIDKFINPVLNYGIVSLHEDVFSAEFWKIGIPFALMMFGIIWFVKLFFDPKTKKENEKNHGALFMKNDSWSPILSGIIIGALQLPMLYFTNSMLGASTQYVVLVGHLLSKVFPNVYFEKMMAKKTSIFGLISHVGMVLGGFVSAKLSGNFTRNRAQKGLSGSEKVKVVIAGFFLLFGARMAGGCNSGHGLSGMGSQSVSSYLATTAIFAGGIGLAVLQQLFWSVKKKQ